MMSCVQNRDLICLQCTCFILFTECFVLVYWPDEDSTSVVRQSAILTPSIADQAVGVACTVKTGRSKCTGRIAGMGMQHVMYTCMYTYVHVFTCT